MTLAPQMSREELLSLPATVDLATGNRAFGIGRNTGYTLAKQGRYPCRIIRVGTAYRVITEDLHRALGLMTAAQGAA
ncbi:DNA-binding protein [Nonomuraea angiospora]|uniref:DNA-binding protein n=1 Tax=Nonomuraea angiospora TaxID=46172 RepID=UPI0029AAE87D|nr:DNA-binding protein [Nonomuraea angiospora]MDX3099704.1 DNA-binding protein [Nonomuraea angiospora]